MKKILLPVDFSPISASAAKYAVALAFGFRAELTVLHVAMGHPPYNEINGVCLPPADALEVAWNETRLKEANDTMVGFVSSHLGRIPVIPCVPSGDAAKVIVEHAHTTASDLIVMGTHGFGGFGRMLRASITAKVLHDARCPFSRVQTQNQRQAHRGRYVLSYAQEITVATVKLYFARLTSSHAP